MKTLAVAVGWILTAALARPGTAVSFVVEPATTCCGVLPDNIYLEGTVGGAPLYGGVALGVDAISYGHLPIEVGLPTVFFSVSAASAGIAKTAVSAEAALLEQEADIFTSDGDGSNAVAYDGDGMGPSMAPPLGLLEGMAGVDNVNALDMRSKSPTDMIYFSVDAFTAGAYGGPPAGSAAHVYAAKAVPLYDAPVPPIYASEADLGLVPGDDVDALTVYDDGDVMFGKADIVRFSLTPGSPSLGKAGPADIFEVDGLGAAPVVTTPAAALGLLFTDDVDAIAIDAPEPAAGLLWCSSLLGLWILHRWRGRERARPASGEPESFF